MAVHQPADFLTVAEAAEYLKVSTATIKRWLKQGRLPAYHAGPKAVRIRRADLSRILRPIAREEVSPTNVESRPVIAQLPVQPLAGEELERAEAAIRRSAALIARMRARRGGEPAPSSVDLIREAREERSARL